MDLPYYGFLMGPAQMNTQQKKSGPFGQNWNCPGTNLH